MHVQRERERNFSTVTITILCSYFHWLAISYDCHTLLFVKASSGLKFTIRVYRRYSARDFTQLVPVDNLVEAEDCKPSLIATVKVIFDMLILFMFFFSDALMQCVQHMKIIIKTALYLFRAAYVYHYCFNTFINVKCCIFTCYCTLNVKSIIS